MTKKTLITCRDFLKTLGQTIKLMTLYKQDHPVPTSALQECHSNLKSIFKDMDWKEITFSAHDGRWYVNETVLSETAHIPEILVDLFRLQELHSVTFLKGILLYELAALCELGALPSKEVKEVAAVDFLKQKGVRHMNTQIVDEYARAHRKLPQKPPAARQIESPIPRQRHIPMPPPPPAYEGITDYSEGVPQPQYYPPASPYPDPAGGSMLEPDAPYNIGGYPGDHPQGLPSSRQSAPLVEGSPNILGATTPRRSVPAGSGYGHIADPNQGFGGFIKGLVEHSVSDPHVRAQIYSDTLRMVKNTIEQKVAQSTRHLRLQRQVVLNERVRTENVISGFAGGRVTVDSNGRILMLDPIAENIFGKRLVEVAGRPLMECVNEEQQFAALSDDIKVPTDRSISKNIRLAGRNQNVQAFRSSMAVVEDEQGRIVGTYGIMPHETKFKEAARKEEEFISHVTHELKAPLSSICSALEILDEMTGSKMKKQEKKFLDISRRNSARLRAMIDEILDFSKIKAGKLQTELAPTEIEPVLQEATEGLLPWANSKKITLTLETQALTGDARKVIADHGRVVQIITNLISNAIKNTPKEGAILVSAAPGTGKHEGTTVITVKDNGIGISPENQRKIFERFQQVSLKGKHRDGVGLGLTIVKHLITSHHGSLWLESAENKGAAFHFSLPMASIEPPVPL